MNNELIKIILVILILSSLTASSQETKMIDGVKTIINKGDGKWKENSEVELMYIGSIGELESDDENYNLFLPVDITLDKKGNIYILDSGNYLVKKFNADGKFLISFGGKGQGPGEFQMPVSLDIRSDGNIVVAGQSNNRMEIFTSGGESVKSYRPGELRAGYFCLDANDNFVLSRGLTGGIISSYYEVYEKNRTRPLLSVYDKNGEVISKIGDLPFQGNDISEFVANYFSFCIDKMNNYYIAFRKLNRIDKYGPYGNILFRIERPLNYKVMKPKKADVREKERGGRTVTIPRMNLVSEAIAVDGKERIWVVTANRQMKESEKADIEIRISAENEYAPMRSVTGNSELLKTDMYDLEIFNKDGLLLGRIRINHFVDGMKIFNDRLFILDKLRGMRYYEYRIIG